MTHTKVILNILEDGAYHCGNEFRKVYIGEFRSRINELRKKGYVIQAEPCSLNHTHEGRTPNMWKLEGYTPEKIGTFRGELASPAPQAQKSTHEPSSPYTGRIMREMAELTQPRLFVN